MCSSDLSATFNNLSDNSFCIVKPDLSWNATYIFKHRYQPFQQALHVFTVVELEISTITVGKAENKILCFMMKLTVFIEISISKVNLSLTGMVLKRKISFLVLKV